MRKPPGSSENKLLAACQSTKRQLTVQRTLVVLLQAFMEPCPCICAEWLSHKGTHEIESLRMTEAEKSPNYQNIPSMRNWSLGKLECIQPSIHPLLVNLEGRDLLISDSTASVLEARRIQTPQKKEKRSDKDLLIEKWAWGEDTLKRERLRNNCWRGVNSCIYWVLTVCLKQSKSFIFVSDLILIITLGNRSQSQVYFSDKDIEAHREELLSIRSNS